LQTVDAVPFRQRLPVQAGEHGGSQLPTERDTQVRRPLLPGYQFRGGRGIRPRGGAIAETATVQTAAGPQAAHSTATAPAHATARAVYPTPGAIATTATTPTSATATATTTATVRPTTIPQPSVPHIRGDQHTVTAEATSSVAATATQLPTATATAPAATATAK